MGIEYWHPVRRLSKLPAAFGR